MFQYWNWLGFKETDFIDILDYFLNYLIGFFKWELSDFRWYLIYQTLKDLFIMISFVPFVFDELIQLSVCSFLLRNNQSLQLLYFSNLLIALYYYGLFLLVLCKLTFSPPLGILKSCFYHVFILNKHSFYFLINLFAIHHT